MMRFVKPGAQITDSRAAAKGFTLVELMVAIAVFVVIGGAALNLVRKHQTLFNTQQNQAGLNMVLRSAIAQMQIDVVNAGTGYDTINVQPLGISIINSNAGAGCNTPGTFSYGPSCFDTLNVLSADPNTPPANPTDALGTCNNPVDTTSTDTYLTLPGTPTAAQINALALSFRKGDQILFIKTNGISIAKLTTAVLTDDGKVSSGLVKLQHNPTGADGTNVASNDPFGLSPSDPTHPSTILGASFCGTTDWVLKVAATTYYVDATDPTNPKLRRRVGGNDDIVAEQVIGFKVGASDTTNPAYTFDSSAYQYNWPAIRSIRVSLIGRTTPNTDVTNSFRNSLDNGPYKIEAVSVVIYPRNLSDYDPL